METDTEIHEFINLFSKKADFDDAVFEMENFQKIIDYKSMTSEKSREEMVISHVEVVNNSILKDFFNKKLKKKDFAYFEPGNLKTTIENINKIAADIKIIGVTTAVDLKAEDFHKISKKIAPPDKKILFEITVDPSILGGVIIKKDNYILDYSIKTKLANLGRDWKKSIHASKEK